ncbi:MAG: hypothetical protein U1E50_17290 [Caulobacteraceae bacterium]
MQIFVAMRRWALAVIAAMLALLALGAPANAAPGYWRFTGYSQTPSDSELASARPIPGHVYKKDADTGFGGSGGRINIHFLTDDADARPMEARSHFTFSADRDLMVLTPGQRVVFSGSVDVSANDLAAPIASAWARVSIDNGDYIVDATARVGSPARGSGVAVIPGGVAGSVMVIHFANQLGQNGAVGVQIDARYEFVAGEAPGGPSSGGPAPGLGGPNTGGPSPYDSPGGPGGPSSGSPSGPAQTFSDNWNTAGCGMTDTATLVVTRSTRLDRVEIWYHWSQGETQVGFSVDRDGQTIGSGFLTRGSCDPYQNAWCVAQGWGGRTLQPGRYRFRLYHPQICQNSGSGGQGFVRGVGWPAASGASGNADGGIGPSASGDFSGRWNSTEGVMTLNQSSGRITGTYVNDNGRIEATVQGATASGFWAEDSSGQRCSTQRLGSYYWGRVTWIMRADGQHFDGRWSYCEGQPSGSWTGDRIGAAPVTGNPGGGPSLPQNDGNWTSPSSGPGTYNQPAAMIIDVTEGPWRGTWTQRVAGGPFEATWRNEQTGAVASDTLTLETVSGNLRVFYRQGMNGRYYAAVGPDGRSLVGTGSWYSARDTWTGRIR